MIRISRAIAAIAVAVALFASGAAHAEITVYNAQHETLARAWIDAFTKLTGIKVNYRQGSDLELANVLVQEGRNSPADVFLTENSPAMALVDAAGMFAPVDPTTLALLPEYYRAGNGHWTGIAARTTVFVYNPAKVPAASLPKSMLDLADPVWKGRWGASPSGPDFQAVISAMLELKGESATADFLRGMKTNATAYRGNDPVMRAVNAGQIDGGVIYHYYYYGDRARTGEGSKNVALHYFKNQDPGAFISVSGGGVLASSKNQAEAQKFLQFILSKQGQDLLQAATEYPVVTGVEPLAALPPLSGLDAPKLDPAKLNSRKVTELMTRAGIL